MTALAKYEVGLYVGLLVATATPFFTKGTPSNDSVFDGSRNRFSRFFIRFYKCNSADAVGVVVCCRFALSAHGFVSVTTPQTLKEYDNGLRFNYPYAALDGL